VLLTIKLTKVNARKAENIGKERIRTAFSHGQDRKSRHISKMLLKEIKNRPRSLLFRVFYAISGITGQKQLTPIDLYAKTCNLGFFFSPCGGLGPAMQVTDPCTRAGRRVGTRHHTVHSV
jgi:hypothetical protein